MIRISLFRHAKSSWDIKAKSDFDRPLAARGIHAARRMGRYMAATELLPDRVYCSDAKRARQTCDLAFGDLGNPPHITYMEQLYLADPSKILNMIRTQFELTDHIMLIGHNPGFQALALGMAPRLSKDVKERISAKFPTAAFIVYDFDISELEDVSPGKGVLVNYMTPKDLPQKFLD
ncbi:MAG: SixA phosphatase family protein [Methyloligellaceae bacterium]